MIRARAAHRISRRQMNAAAPIEGRPASASSSRRTRSRTEVTRIRPGPSLAASPQDHPFARQCAALLSEHGMSLSRRPPSLLLRRDLLRSALGAVLPALIWPGTASAAAPKPLLVGGLPVTCNLTLPVACVARAAANGAAKGGGPQFEFEYSKYNGWPEIKESLMAGRIQAAYMLAPLVMDLADKKIPVKIVSLGHRSGAVIMVRTDSPYQRFRDLAGKRIAIPSRFAVDFLFLRKMLAPRGHDAEGHPDRRDGAARHAGRAVRQGGGCLLHRRALRRGRPARRLCARAADDARRVAQLHLLRADRARGADRGEPAAGAGPRQPRARRRPMARPEAGEPRTRRSPSPPAASSSTRTRRSSASSWKIRSTG